MFVEVCYRFFVCFYQTTYLEQRQHLNVLDVAVQGGKISACWSWSPISWKAKNAGSETVSFPWLFFLFQDLDQIETSGDHCNVTSMDRWIFPWKAIDGAAQDDH